MFLVREELDAFHRQGFVVRSARLGDAEIDLLLAQLPGIAVPSESVALENDGETVRALHGCHMQNPAMAALPRHGLLLAAAQQLLGGDVYLYQFKINMKAAFSGDVWPWHHDYVFWAREDGMPAPNAITIGVFLDDVTEFNGPMFFIPGSHKSDVAITTVEPETGADGWVKHVSATLSYQVDTAQVVELASRHGMAAPKGPRGSILIFDSRVVHASPANVSPMQRRIAFITYNSVHNRPTRIHRPEFLVNADATPLVVAETPS